jgi:hypothetical protein
MENTLAGFVRFLPVSVDLATTRFVNFLRLFLALKLLPADVFEKGDDGAGK